MSILFQGGPLDGQVGGEPPMDPAAEPAAPVEELGEGERLARMLDDARAILAMGELSEKSKLLVEQATTLIQRIRALEEKEAEDAMSGKLSPNLVRKLGAGGSY